MAVAADLIVRDKLYIGGEWVEPASDQTIDVINPGESKTLSFGNLGQVPFASQTKVTVDVKAVPGETNTSNNSATYNVIFSLP